jgi:anti-anti-sigma regulatory factor
MTVPGMLVLSPQGERVVVQVRGRFDVEAAQQLEQIASDYLDGGGTLQHLVVDLRPSTACSTPALERLADLLSAGLRVR